MEIQLNLNATRIEIPTDAIIRETEIIDYLTQNVRGNSKAYRVIMTV